MNIARIPRPIWLAASLVALLSACQTPPPRVERTWALPEGVQEIDTNGYPTAYVSKGTGTPVVILHGVLCDYRCMGAQVRDLSPNFRVMSVSMRHFYPEKWQGDGSTFTVQQHVRDVAAFIEKMGGPAHVIGWSYGGRIAYELARTRPDLVKKLVLAEGAVAFPADGDSGEATLGRERATETEKRFRTVSMDDGLEYSIDAINGPGVWKTLPPPSRALVRDNAWTIVGLGKDIWPQATCKDFGALKMPVLLVRGEKTTERFKTIVKEQGDCLPPSKVVIVPNGGHTAPLTQAAFFNAAVGDFLKQ